MAPTVSDAGTTAITSVEGSALVASAAADAEEADKEFDAQGNLRTVTSNLIVDFFIEAMKSYEEKRCELICVTPVDIVTFLSNASTSLINFRFH